MPLLALCCALIAIQTPHPLVGLAINVTEGGGEKELVQAILDQRKLGLNLIQNSTKWSDIEPSDGKLTVDKLSHDLAGGSSIGFVPVVTLQTIDTTNKTVPADLMGEAWDSPKMLDRERWLIKSVVSALPSSTPALMLGNEVDVYLSNHPTEVDAYLKFLSVGIATAKHLRPDLKIGVTATFTGLTNNKDLIARINKNMDLVSFTYYPLQPDFTVFPPGNVGADIDTMVAFAAPKQIYIQEAGYPASEILGSSETKQKEFVDNLFDSLARHQPEILGACYFISLDLSNALVKRLLSYYSLADKNFEAYLATLGLEKSDGTPRSAWAEFRKRAAAFLQ